MPNPTQWDNDYLTNLFKFEWKQTRSPAGALQWEPTDPDAPRTPDGPRPGKTHPLMMMTSDIALKVDPVYREICLKFLEDFDYFTLQFSKAWYKLTHRDMARRSAMSGRRRSRGRPAVAGSDPAGRSPADRRSGHRVAQAGDPGHGPVRVGSRLRGVLVRLQLIATATSAAAPTGRASPSRREDWTVNRRAIPVIEALRGIASGFNGKAGGGKRCRWRT